jgi:outer membrane protein OmpA-like peptidoglycan-associated protein
MRIVLARACVLAAVGLTALGQAGAYGQEAPALSADELTRVLAPAATAGGGAGYGLRALRPGGGVTKVAAGTATAAAALPAGAEGSGVVPDLRLLFPYDSAELTPATKKRLDELGRALKGPALQGYGFEIAGHTDAAGDDGYNMALSRKRAEAVAGYLGRAHRVARTRLEAKGYGETALAEPAEPTSPRNRRVEVRTLR